MRRAILLLLAQMSNPSADPIQNFLVAGPRGAPWQQNRFRQASVRGGQADAWRIARGGKRVGELEMSQ